MALRVYKFASIDEFEWFLRGGIVGGTMKVSDKGPGLWGLVGLTATFAVPAGSVTFVVGTDVSGFLTFKEIKTQIEAAVAGLSVRMNNNKICIIESTPTNGVDIGSAGAEPARAILGFDGGAGGHVKAKVINPMVGAAPAVPYLVQFVARPEGYAAIIME